MIKYILSITYANIFDNDNLSIMIKQNALLPLISVGFLFARNSWTILNNKNI